MSCAANTVLRSALLVGASVLALACATGSQAQTTATTTAAAAIQAAGAGSVQQITVTVERRSTNIQATPLAISAVSAGTLDQSFVTQISSLNAMVPSLEVIQASGFENLVTIRGVGSETPENATTTVPGVSQFIDGVYIANTISLDQTLFDVDHIEVLRGPQGALYGQSSIGGAINIVTKQPELNSFGGAGDFSGGTYNLTRARAELNVPVSETVAIRGSVQKYDHDGFTRNTYFPDYRLDDAHDLSGKAALLWKPTSNFSATLTGQWYHSAQHGAAQKNILDLNPDPRELAQDYPSKFRLTTQLYHLNLQWDLPEVSVRSVSAYQQLGHVQQEDSDRSTFSALKMYDDVAAWNTGLKNYTEELDFLSPAGSSLEWIVGGFAMVQSSTQFVAEFEGSDPVHSNAVTPTIQTSPPGNLSYGNDTRVARQSYSGFGQATYHVTPALRLTVGGRYNHDSYTHHSHNFSAFGVNTVSHAYTDNVATWRAEADYDVTPDNMAYVSAARGYKPGGLNGIYGQAVIPESFAPETNTAFEVGSKNYFLDRTMTLNLAAYYYLYKNMQYIENDPVPFDGGIANIPSVHAYGVEVEASYVAPDKRLRLNGHVAIEDAKVKGDYFTIDSTVQNAIENQGPPSPCAFGGAYYNPACWAAVIASARNIKDKSPPAMPKFSGSINASYDFDIPPVYGAPGGTLTPRIEFVYRGDVWERVFNEPTLDKIKGYGVTNLNLDYVPAGSRFRLSVTATNLFNVTGVNSRYTDPYGTGQTSEQFIPPRQVIATIAYSF